MLSRMKKASALAVKARFRSAAAIGTVLLTVGITASDSALAASEITGHDRNLPRNVQSAAAALEGIPDSGSFGERLEERAQICPLPLPIIAEFRVADTSPVMQAISSSRLADECLVVVSVAQPKGGQDRACEVTVARAPTSETDAPRRVSGVSFTVSLSAGCEDVPTRLVVSLPPRIADAADKTTVDHEADAQSARNPWTQAGVRGKITGQDVINIDMLWNQTELVWWQDGYAAGWGYDSALSQDGGDQWWYATYGLAFLDTSALPNHYRSYHERNFHSDGFPYSWLPDINAFTKLEVFGYYNGYGACSFVHNYDNGAQFYPNLHWRDDCYYMW